MISGLFDSHAHYYDPKFEGGADSLLTSLFSDGLSGVINVGTNPDNCRFVIEQAARHEKMYAAVGIHPEDCNFIENMSDALAIIEELLKNKDKYKIVALGEIGYDYFHEPLDKQKQYAYFDAQMKLAQKYAMPVIIHDRDAHGDAFDMICRYPDVHGVFHSYSSSLDMAKELCRRGWYVSFSGVLTFKNARKLPEVAEVVPEDMMLIETDCPYLAPVPYRGQLNHSGLMEMTAVKLAEIRGKSPEEIAAVTRQNAEKLFGTGK